MSRVNFVREQLASHFMSLLPESINSHLLSDKEFVEALDISLDTSIVFKEENVSFSRDILFDAVRNSFLEIGAKFQLTDKDGNAWTVSSIPNEKSAFSLVKGNIEIKNSTFWPLISQVEKRLEIFEEKSKVGMFSSIDAAKWTEILSGSFISDQNVSDLLLDIDCSPAHVEELLREEFSGSTNNVNTLAPDSAGYYSRLIGRYTKSAGIDEFCANELKEFFENRVDKKIDINDLLICSHSSISKVVAEYLIDPIEFLQVAKIALDLGHPILLIACLEVGIKNFIGTAATEIRSLYRRLTSQDVLDNLRLFCSMTIFVDGELARLQIFKDSPPFYRRLASLTQSALIVKVALLEGIAFGKIEHWASQQRGLFFFCQSFVDLRSEHRWLPSYLTAEQHINELYGRLSNICDIAEKNECIREIVEDLVQGKRLTLSAFLPGPLEGNSKPIAIPDEISNLLFKKIDKNPTPESFVVLINSAPFWKIDEEHLDRIVTLLEEAQHQLRSVHDKDSVYQVLTGLAHVSCVSRNTKLASSLFVLSRIYRDFLEVDSDPQNYLAMGIVAAAAHGDIDGWANYIGRWSTELVYLPLSTNSALKIHSMLERLCIQEPYLFYTCSKALDILKMLSEK
ncbi:MAG: hypothetical protein AAGC78_12870 [Cellvibrio sp.]|uniref:hypothetical protein n=1 Tax=Cellvibrio sp. TaxID=1965322 RepID=UPI0031ABF6E9